MPAVHAVVQDEAPVNEYRPVGHGVWDVVWTVGT